MHLKAVFFVRCSEQNIKLICQQLKEPVFSSYYLCKQRVRYVLVFKLYFLDFSNTVSKNVISQLAEADSENHNVVQQI